MHLDRCRLQQLRLDLSVHTVKTLATLSQIVERSIAPFAVTDAMSLVIIGLIAQTHPLLAIQIITNAHHGHEVNILVRINHRITPLRLNRVRETREHH